MSNISFPIVCHTEEELEDVIPFITEVFYQNNHYHFNPLSHKDENCARSKHEIKMGEHVGFKIVYIAEHLRRKCLQIIAMLNKKYPEHLDEQVSDDEDNLMRLGQRMPQIIFKCPACHLEFDCE